MKSLKSMLSAAAILVAGITANAQTADDIIAKHIDAIGGKDKLSQVTSMVTESSVTVMGNEAPATTTLLVGKGYKNEMEANGQKIVQAVTDKSGWAINPFAGGTDAAAMPDDQYKGMKGQIYLDPFLDYAAHGSKVELKGTDGGAYKIVLTNSDNDVTTYYIDTATYFITKVTRTVNVMGNDAEVTFTFGDHKKTDFGNVVPYTMGIDYGQFQLSYAVKKVTVNGTVDPAVFDMPK